MAMVLAGYNWAAFGSPFRLGYGNVEGFRGNEAGPIWGEPANRRGSRWCALGTSRPAGDRATAGIRRARTHPGHQTRATPRDFRCLSCLLHLSHPDEYFVPLLGWRLRPVRPSPFVRRAALLGHGHGAAIPPSMWTLRVLAIAALAAGGFVTLMGVSVHGMTPYQPKHPLSDLYWPAFLLGRFAKHTGWSEVGGPATNLGLAMGLEILLLAAACACAHLRICRARVESAAWRTPVKISRRSCSVATRQGCHFQKDVGGQSLVDQSRRRRESSHGLLRYFL